MRSSTDKFWKAVERWHSSTEKPLIVVECSGGGNWPAAVVKGTVARFAEGRSITFALEDGNFWGLELEGCVLVAVTIPLDLSEMEVAARFSVRCDEKDGGTSTFVFTELRNFGEPN